MRGLPPVLLLLALCGCERAAQNMYDQPRYEPYEPSPLFEGGASQPPPAGAIAVSLGRPAEASGGLASEAFEPLPPVDAKNPLPRTMAVLRRGRERYEIYCAPCHSVLGDGEGYIVHRGFPQPPSFHEARLRAAPDAHFYQVITGGYGAMLPYAGPVSPQDRWAIIHYIRALQLSQHAELDKLPPAQAAAAREALP